MNLVQDSASAAGLGDAGKRVMEQYDLESEIKKREKASAGAGKAAQAKLMETYGGVLSKPYEEFKPSQESLGGFAALGSLLMVAGAMMGGQGRLSGIGAMNNIAGMMKGYQEGRKDLYEQERKQFEENMKTFEKNRGMIKEAFDRALKIAPTNLKLANDMLRRDLQALGATVPAEMVGKSGAVHAAGSYGNFNKNTDQTLESLKDKLGRMKAEQLAKEADVKALGTGALEYGSIDGVKGMYTREQIIKAGPKFEPLPKPAGEGAGALEYGSIDGVKAMYTRDQIIKAGPRFEPLPKPVADGTRQPVIDADGFYRDPITMELRLDAKGQPVKAGGSRATSWIKSIDDDGKPVYRDKVTKDIITESDGTPVRPPESGKKDAGLKPGVSEVKNYDDHQIMLEDISYLKKKLSDPEFRKKIDKYRWMTYLSDDVNKTMTLMMQEKIPSDVADFVRSASILRNSYYLAISGKAVTGGEAQRNYTVVPQPGDKSSVFEQKLDSMERYLKRSTKVLEYTYPDLEERRKKVESMQTEDDQPSKLSKQPSQGYTGKYEEDLKDPTKLGKGIYVIFRSPGLEDNIVKIISIPAWNESLKNVYGVTGRLKSGEGTPKEPETKIFMFNDGVETDFEVE